MCKLVREQTRRTPISDSITYSFYDCAEYIRLTRVLCTPPGKGLTRTHVSLIHLCTQQAAGITQKIFYVNSDEQFRRSYPRRKLTLVMA